MNATQYILASIAALTLSGSIASANPAASVPGRWSEEKANAWHVNQPWLVGCNFTRSTAINQLEMWQAETFDPVTIDHEPGWAAGMGMNTVRVYLHDRLWQLDSEGFLTRVDPFLGIDCNWGLVAGKIQA